MGGTPLTTILFDLDGTLLDLNMEQFLSPYFTALAARLAAHMGPDALVQALIASTRAMISNTDPGLTNREAFWEDFLPRVDGERAGLLAEIEVFYTEDFPKLAEHSRPRPEARDVLAWCFDHGLKVTIATNPVFPKAAICERLRWAGVDDFPYVLVTTYEIMHFCKPNPDYYREVLGMVGSEAEEALMVGNDVELDLAAALAGLRTFLVRDSSAFDPETGRLSPRAGRLPADTPTFRGRLTDVPQTISSLI